MGPITRNVVPAETTYSNVVCTKCGEPLFMVYGDNKTEQRILQPNNGLHLINCYGYGMWRDHDLEGSSVRDIVICAPCTIEFLKENPWLEEYLSE